MRELVADVAKAEVSHSNTGHFFFQYVVVWPAVSYLSFVCHLLRHSFLSVSGKSLPSCLWFWMLFLLSFCLCELLTCYPGCFYSQNHLLFLKEYLSIPLLLNGCLQLCPAALRCCCLLPDNESSEVSFLAQPRSHEGHKLLLCCYDSLARCPRLSWGPLPVSITADGLFSCLLLRSTCLCSLGRDASSLWLIVWSWAMQGRGFLLIFLL